MQHDFRPPLRSLHAQVVSPRLRVVAPRPPFRARAMGMLALPFVFVANAACSVALRIMKAGKR